MRIFIALFDDRRQLLILLAQLPDLKYRITHNAPQFFRKCLPPCFDIRGAYPYLYHESAPPSVISLRLSEKCTSIFPSDRRRWHPGLSACKLPGQVFHRKAAVCDNQLATKKYETKMQMFACATYTKEK